MLRGCEVLKGNTVYTKMPKEYDWGYMGGPCCARAASPGPPLHQRMNLPLPSLNTDTHIVDSVSSSVASPCCARAANTCTLTYTPLYLPPPISHVHLLNRLVHDPLCIRTHNSAMLGSRRQHNSPPLPQYPPPQ